MSSYDPFFGRNAMLFGAATGIGRAVADEFVKRGAKLAIADINITAAEQAVEEINANSGKAIAIRCDVTSDASMIAACAQVEKQIGAIDIAFNNVGSILKGNPQDIPVTEWQRMMEINFMGAVRAQNALLPGMIERRRGHIVNTCSFAGLYPFATSRMPYAAAKAALIALSESQALYLAPQGIRVSAFCVGPVMTSIADAGKMKTWSEDCIFRGPGSDLPVKLPETVAAILADGMAAQKVIICTDEIGYARMRDHGADPEGFIRAKLAEFEAGDSGRPFVPDELLHLVPPEHRR